MATQGNTITREVIHNRLMQIGYEGGLVLQQCAVSPGVVEAKDLGFNVSDAEGRTIVYSTWMPRHGTTLSYMLKSIMETFEGEILPGDMYIVNDPHAGALHSLDIAVIAPVHVDGELVAWVGNATHHMDIGAMNPGRAPLATDAFQEGVTIRGLKLVVEGKIDEHVFRLFSDNVRVPRAQNMDLKAQISANFAAREKVEALVRKYGVETYRDACETSLNLAEESARARIAALPDGRYEVVEHLDYDKDYVIKAALEIKGDRMIFDLTGTDPQSHTFINSALPCTVANMHNILACQLFPDLEVNEGTFRAIDVTIPSGTVLSAEFPMPNSGASTMMGWKAQQVTLGLLSQAIMGTDQEFRAQAQWGWGFAEPSWSGLDQHGRYYTTKGDSTMHGGGARRHTDGIDVSNIAGSTNTSLPSIESYELRYPLLYLSRGLVPDSEGAGEFRGGLAGEWTRVLYGVEDASELVFYMGRDYGAEGFAGGQAGATARVTMKRGTDVWSHFGEDVPTFADLSGDEEVLPQQPDALSKRLGKNDVIQVRGMGGGGFGRPEDRDPESVQRDVELGFVSRERAKSVYGVGD